MLTEYLCERLFSHHASHLTLELYLHGDGEMLCLEMVSPHSSWNPEQADRWSDKHTDRQTDGQTDKLNGVSALVLKLSRQTDGRRDQ